MEVEEVVVEVEVEVYEQTFSMEYDDIWWRVHYT